MLNAAGVPADPGQPVEGARLLVEHDIFVYGSPEQIASELDRYQSAGVDEVVLNPAGTLLTYGVEAAMADLTQVAQARGATESAG